MVKNCFFLKDNSIFIPKHWRMCVRCNSILFIRKIKLNFSVCYNCDYYFRLSARDRVSFIFKNNPYIELFDYIYPIDFLDFIDIKKYSFRIVQTQMLTKEVEALLVFKGKINFISIIICIFEFDFIGGSMGYVVGNKFISAVNLCIKENMPLLCFSSSGGARMQESLLSLFQMPKVSAVLSNMFLPYISIIVNPCLGGVTASLAMLGDINISEPGVMVGFTGPKIISGVVNSDFNIKFQCSEFLLKNGFLDFIITRKDFNKEIYILLEKMLNI